jgi:hypothetical protein
MAGELGKFYAFLFGQIEFAAGNLTFDNPERFFGIPLGFAGRHP